MKDIYSLLNNVETNIDFYTIEELTDVEKRKLIKEVKEISSNDNGHKAKTRNYATIAACVVTIVLIAGTISLNDGVYATAKSIAWQISDFLGVEKNLQDYTTVLGTEQTDKGYTIKLNEIILDENQLIVSSSVQSKQKLGEGGLIASADVYVNGKRVSVAAGGSSKTIDAYTEESLLSYELEDIDTNSRLDIELIYTDILKDSKVINGKWDFCFTADGRQLALDTDHIALKHSFTLPNGSEVILTEYTSNDLGQKVYFKLKNYDYKKDPMYDFILKGKDNLGNDTEFELSYMKGEEKVGRFNSSALYKKIGGEATSLTLKPYAVKMPEKSGKMSHDYVEIGDEFTINLLKNND